MTHSKTGSLFALLLFINSVAFADSSPTGFLPRAIRNQLAIPTGIIPAVPSKIPDAANDNEPVVAGSASATQPDQDPTIAAQSTAGRVLSLLDYMKSHVTHETIDQLDTDNQGYNRREDFGGWIVADSKQGCQDTRAIVLVRAEDTSTPMTYKDARNCLVVKGLWHDPYAGQDFKLAKAVQIDHVVPLKHVYLTGGKDWAPQRRCYYANFIHNDFHLLAVSGHENMSKSDKSPDQYLPPNAAFQCQYVSSWMKVKAIWGLIATDAEIAAIESVIQTQHCADSKLQYGEDDLKAEQAAIDSSVPTRCVDFGTQGAAAMPAQASALNALVPPLPPPQALIQAN